MPFEDDLARATSLSLAAAEQAHVAEQELLAAVLASSHGTALGLPSLTATPNPDDDDELQLATAISSSLSMTREGVDDEEQMAIALAQSQATNDAPQPLPPEAEAANAAGLAANSAGDFGEALQYFSRALSIVPSPRISLSAANMKLKLGDAEGAITQVRARIVERRNGVFPSIITRRPAALALSVRVLSTANFRKLPDAPLAGPLHCSLPCVPLVPRSTSSCFTGRRQSGSGL